MKKYLVFDVGCIECGEDSCVVGIYRTNEDARKAIDDYIDEDSRWGRKEWHGQHFVDIYPIEMEDE